MKAFIYNGEDMNISRFGLLRKNDHIKLTDQEIRGIAEDPRFVELKDPKKAPKPGHFITITQQMTGDEIKVAKAANVREVSRLQRLQEECSEIKMFEMEIRNQTYDQLLARAQKLNRDAGKEVVRADDGIPRGELVVSLMNYLRSLTKVPIAV